MQGRDGNQSRHAAAVRSISTGIRTRQLRAACARLGITRARAHRADGIPRHRYPRGPRDAQAGIRGERGERADGLMAARAGDGIRGGACAPRGRSPGRRPWSPRDLLAQGVPAADPTVPRLLPLLHVRQGAAASRQRLPAAREGGGHCSRGRASGLQGGAVHAGRTSGAALSGGARLAAGSWIRQHAALSRACRGRGSRQDRVAAAYQRRLHVGAGNGDAAAGVRLDGPHAGKRGDAARREGRAASRLAGQGAGNAARHHRRGRAAKDTFHHRHLDRNRGNARRAVGGAPRHSRAA